MAKKASEPAATGGGRARLGAQQIARGLERLPGWSIENGRLARTYVLPGFRAALAFVAYVGEVAEARNHHPDVDVRYNRVALALSTHDAGGVTAKDFDLARLIDGGEAGGEA